MNRNQGRKNENIESNKIESLFGLRILKKLFWSLLDVLEHLQARQDGITTTLLVTSLVFCRAQNHTRKLQSTTVTSKNGLWTQKV